jgi:outer membrane lipoprotein SlyB
MKKTLIVMAAMGALALSACSSDDTADALVSDYIDENCVG